MEIHIGRKIHARAKELRIGPTELGKIVNTSSQNMNNIYKRASVDSGVLFKLSLALKYNFFECYNLSELPSQRDKEYAKGLGELKKEIETLKKGMKTSEEKNEALKEKNAMLTKINDLLEKGKRK